MNRLYTAALAMILACGRAAPSAAPAAPPLEVVEWTSPGADPAAALPTVVLVHGYGARPEGILPLLQGLAGPVRVVAPRGTFPVRDGFGWLDPPGVDDQPGDKPAELTRQVGRVLATLDGLERAGRVAGKPVITGFSQGGMLAFAAAAAAPSRFAGAVPIGGDLPASLVPSRCAAPVPIHALHGEADTVVPVAGPRAAVEALAAAGCDATLRAWPGVPHRITGEMRQILYGEIGTLLGR